jgi:hypothetical protein
MMGYPEMAARQDRDILDHETLIEVGGKDAAKFKSVLKVRIAKDDCERTTSEVMQDEIFW